MTTTCATCGKQMLPAEAMHRLEGERIVHYCYPHWQAQRERHAAQALERKELEQQWAGRA